MRYLFWQSSDATVYMPMLDITGAHNKIYCDQNEIEYEAVIGVMRGMYSWQAIFNRIVKLKELTDLNFSGWFIYADADSYVYDMSFDLKEYLTRHNNYVLIAASGGDARRLAVNDGIFFLNMARSEGHDLAREWYALMCDKAPLEYLEKTPQWVDGVVNDQELLHEVLGKNHTFYDPLTLVDDGKLINYQGRFMRQALRSFYGTLERRVEAIAADIAASQQLHAPLLQRSRPSLS